MQQLKISILRSALEAFCVTKIDTACYSQVLERILAKPGLCTKT